MEEGNLREREKGAISDDNREKGAISDDNREK